MSVDHVEVQHDVNFQDVSILLKQWDTISKRSYKKNRHFGLVDKETLKVLLKAPTETIGGMNVVISWCRVPPYKGYLWGRLNTAAPE